MELKELLSVSLILFSIIDIPGNVPIIISMKEKGVKIESGKATLVSGVLMILFLYVGERILHLFGVDLSSFATAGGVVIFIIGLEMILGIEIFKHEEDVNSGSIVPVAFPLIAGAGTLTTILSLRAEFHTYNIIGGIVVNLIIVYVVLRSSSWIQRKVGRQGTSVLRKIFGIILLAIAIKLIKSNWALEI